MENRDMRQSEQDQQQKSKPASFDSRRQYEKKTQKKFTYHMQSCTFLMFS